MDDRSDRALRDWVSEGRISFEQAEAIEPGPEPWPLRRVTEALLYLGATAFTLAVLIWYFDLTQRWDFTRGPNQWGGFGVTIAGALVLAALAWVLDKDPGPVRRAAGFLLALAVVHWFFAVGAAFAALDWYGEWHTLGSTLIGMAAAFGAWWILRAVPTEVGLYGAAAQVVLAIVALIQESTYDPISLDTSSLTGTSAGLLMWLLGAGWVWLGHRGVLRSANAAYLLGGATVVGASVGLTLGVGRWWIVLSGATAVAIGAVAVRLQRTVLMVPAAAGVLATITMGVVLWAQRPPVIRTWVMIFGIPGLVLLGAALQIADRARRPTRAATPPTPADVGDPGGIGWEDGPSDG